MPRCFVRVTALLFILFSRCNCDSQTQECSADGTCSETNNVRDAGECTNRHEMCEDWASEGECQANPQYMFQGCSKACGVCFGDKKQSLGSPSDHDRSIEKLKETMIYVDTFRKNETVKPAWDKCSKSLSHTHCTLWATQGECDANPSYMRIRCAAVCQSCEYLDIETRCPVENVTSGVWGPGDLDKFFINLTSDANSKYEVNILSQPLDGPWIVTIENFITQQEADHMIELGGILGYKSSKGFGGLNEDGTSRDIIAGSRTSQNAWCSNACAMNQTSQELMHRISQLTSIPIGNQEDFQLLNYDVGQFYKSHHDLIAHHIHRQPGVRILTVFLYLNSVEAGGGTRFPLVKNITVEPKVGRALIWPSVLSDDPHKIDPRTDHEALPVLAGQKYAANAWIHQREYKTAHQNSCQ